MDTFRVPYGAGIEEHPRPSILVGSCNRDDFLRDETGSRRFWVIDLPQNPEQRESIDITKVRRDRDAIWKAALLAYQGGRKPILTPDRQLESNRRNRGFEPEHIWLAPLQRWLEVRNSPSPFAIDVALWSSGLRQKGTLNTHDSRIAAVLLRDLGYVQDKLQTRTDGGRRARLWRRASDVSDPPHPSETGQPPCRTEDSMGLSQISDQFLTPSASHVDGAAQNGEKHPRHLRHQPEVPASQSIPPSQIDLALSETSVHSISAPRAESGVGSGADAFLEEDDSAWGPRPEVA